MTRALPANGAGFADARCVRYYQEIRAGVPATAGQIGYGVNRRAVPPVLVRQLTRLHTWLLGDRVTDYSRAGDAAVAALLAELAGQYLGVPLAPEHVVECHGTTEAISVVLHHAAARGLRPVVPVPNYYAFDHSASRAGTPPPAHHRVDGALDPLAPAPAAGGDLLVDVAPNGVLGTWFSTPAVRPGLRLVDHVFALPSFQSQAAVRAELGARCGDLRESVVCLSPSKDLSVPGLRCGLVVTKDQGLLDFAAADRFERGYAVHGSVGPVVATHLAVLLLTAAVPARVPSVHAGLAARFAEAGIPFLTLAEAEEVRHWVARTREAFLDVLAAYDQRGFLLPVAGAEEPVAGYSTFRWLAADFASPESFTAWVNSVGRHGLKLNPNGLFGGDEGVWSRLYPDRYGIRLNLSVDPDELRADLDLLAELLPRKW
ncbi:hypothetical protein JOF53_000318 [Crossiella equi]|uniref:Aminotransferase class I/classII large domain-containing protein n=1 Tax=Crossiella equi TaxID=130796 RepID=A0ABS5A4I2_9PSEU|nr:aminotransferase class I/II-fold pyridoxal phosphate-dependent enzyme [Crossiella equi]MBP2471446.1 hypothetical protein [Crossiella equi]